MYIYIYIHVYKERERAREREREMLLRSTTPDGPATISRLSVFSIVALNIEDNLRENMCERKKTERQSESERERGTHGAYHPGWASNN